MRLTCYIVDRVIEIGLFRGLMINCRALVRSDGSASFLLLVFSWGIGEEVLNLLNNSRDA